MTTIAALRRPSANLACCWSLTSRDDAQQIRPFPRRSKLPTAASKLHLVHQPQPLLPVGRVIHRREAHCAHPRTPSASAKPPIASAAARSRNQPAGSFFGGFRTPARVPVAAISHGRHPKPCTLPVEDPIRPKALQRFIGNSGAARCYHPRPVDVVLRGARKWLLPQ